MSNIRRPHLAVGGLKMAERIRKMALIGLGANLGNRKQTILKAMEALQGLSEEPLASSSLWESSPVDCPPGSPKFLNAVVGLVPRPGETPEALLRQLQELETSFGRQPRKVRNEARSLDLDLLAFKEERRATDYLTLPHPRAHLRRFVLEPLAEIASDFFFPGQSRSVRQMLEDLPPDEGMRVIQ